MSKHKLCPIRTRLRLFGALVGLAAASPVSPSPAVADPVPPPGVPSLPTWTLVPRTDTSIPLATAVLPGAPTELATVPLAQYRYVEEEYLISGTANVYTDDGSEVVAPDVPYTSRIVVRRPSNPNKWSGNVQLGPFRDQNEEAEVWRQNWQYILANGDAFVGFTMAQGNLPFFLLFDPVRYAALSIPVGGYNNLRWDIMAQVAWLVRSPDGPLASAGFPLGDMRVYSSGWSLTGRMQIDFIRRGHHARARTPSGGPVIDGYLIGIIRDALNAPPPDAPVIRFNSEAEVAGGGWAARRPDSDVSGDRFRFYEIAGTSHANFRDQSQFTVIFFQLGLTDLVAVNCLQDLSDLPNKVHFANAGYANLDAWVRQGVAPPPGSDQFIALNPDNSIERDVYGNALGGVRPYWVEVPTSMFDYNSDVDPGDPAHGGQCGSHGNEVPFSAEMLAALYKNHGTYVSRVKQHVDALVRDGYLLRSGAQVEHDRTVHDDVP
jgi:hypothetical protein